MVQGVITNMDTTNSKLNAVELAVTKNIMQFHLMEKS